MLKKIFFQNTIKWEKAHITFKFYFQKSILFDKFFFLCRRFSSQDLKTEHPNTGFIWKPNKSCIFRPAFGCFALKTLVEICFFKVFVPKSWNKKERAWNLLQKVSYNHRSGAKSCWLKNLFPQKMTHQLVEGRFFINLSTNFMLVLPISAF